MTTIMDALERRDGFALFIHTEYDHDHGCAGEGNLLSRHSTIRTITEIMNALGLEYQVGYEE